MSRDDLADLVAFAAVAEMGSFTKAASRLGVSQSALTRAVQQLEGRHQILLLERTTRRLSLTPAGEALLDVVRPALQIIQNQLALLESQRELPSP
ncbi:LysR family transcriptional regulator [Novosphingobium sp. TCA1]|uniref:LysR family transcriptional regulator n=1 Tax=Novosphingobium sp. TCA1 TaxID=2682474 RepID=UPI0013072FB7|nr:LysR family transcriptional regulator [Novosphingobium sp. TCA1]GFE76125.1 hypothetical protein NTCA1_37740 [Novosphingobium sp. TCA1]